MRICTAPETFPDGLKIVDIENAPRIKARQTIADNRAGRDLVGAAAVTAQLAHELVRSSFMPPVPIQELRDLTRTRKQLVREISQHSLRIQKTLEDVNLKPGSVLIGCAGQRRADDPLRLWSEGKPIRRNSPIWLRATQERTARSWWKHCAAGRRQLELSGACLRRLS